MVDGSKKLEDDIEDLLWKGDEACVDCDDRPASVEATEPGLPNFSPSYLFLTST
jgi:hypothetical protein